MNASIGHHWVMSSRESQRARQRAARMFETRSQSWREVGLLREINPHAVRRARLTTVLLLPLFIAIVVFDHHMDAVIGEKLAGEIRFPIKVGSVIALVVLGWVIARDAGRAFGPALFRRLEPATAGTVGFLIRLVAIAVTLWIALEVAGVKAQTLALGGALTAVILGLAAQQTFGNVIAGMVLLSARPFRVGERVRLQGGALAGQVDGIVSSLGLLYTTFAAGEESIMVPNSVVLNVMVVSDDQRIGLGGWLGSSRGGAMAGRATSAVDRPPPAGASAVPPPASATAAPPPPHVEAHSDEEEAVGTPRPPRP